MKHGLHERCSWALLVLLAANPLLDQAISRLVDQTVEVRDEYGRLLSTSPSTTSGTALRLALALGVISLSIAVIYIGYRRARGHLTLFTAFAVVTVSATTLRGGADAGEFLKLSANALALCAAGFACITYRGLSRLGHFAIISAIVNLTYGAVESAAWRPCRDDKCSPTGQLLTGLYTHENSLSRGLIVLLPTMALLPNPIWRRLGLVSLLSIVVLTGSRAALPSAVLAVICYGYLRLQRVNDKRFYDVALVDIPDHAQPVGPGRIFGWLPILAFAGSAGLLVWLPGGALTGRGDIYEIIRQGLSVDPWFGPGRELLARANQQGAIDFLAQHEHGQAPNVVMNQGLIGATVFALALLSVAIRTRTTARAQISAISAPLTVFFLTEPTVTLGSGGVAWPLFLLGIAALPAAPQGSFGRPALSGSSQMRV